MKRIYLALSIPAIYAATVASAEVNVITQDANGDGKVTFEEFIESHDAGITRNQAFIDRHQPIFESADVNNDGFVDTSESQGSGGKVKSGKADKKT